MRTKEGRFLGDLLRLCRKHGVTSLDGIEVQARGPDFYLDDVCVGGEGEATGYAKLGRRIAARLKAKPVAPAPPPGYVQEAGVVRSASIGEEYPGVISFSIYIDTASYTQGFGGRALGPAGGPMMAAGAGLIQRIRGLFGLRDDEGLEALKGRRCYALYKDPYRWNDAIQGLQLHAAEGGGYFLIEDWAREFGLDR